LSAPVSRILRRAAPAALAASALLPASASAHGLVGRTDLPIPGWLFAWGAAIVLIASFVALGTLWPKPRLQHRRARPLFTVPTVVEPWCGLIGIAVFAVVVYCAFEGSSIALANLAPTVIYVHVWVAIPLLSILLGDVFRLFNPWRAAYRGMTAALFRLAPSLDAAPLRWPARLGRWPAVAGLVGFAWLELVYVNRDVPSTLGVLALGYAFVQLVGMSLFGEETWSERGDAFGVYFALAARLSVWERRGRQLCLRPPLSGVPQLEMLPGTVVLLCTIIGTTTFDGASNGALWAESAPKLQTFLIHRGLSLTVAGELTFSLGLALCIGLVAGFYRLGIAGMRSVDPRREPGELARAFAHTLTPIALAYVLAHYFSLLVFQGQAIAYLISDPLGTGANLFGTASTQVDYSFISTSAIWYVQVAALIAGHVAGLVLAHDRALAVFRNDPRVAVRSQYWMLTVMVGFTCLGLWLLSAVNA
jgi:hypothetical protein